ncbi:DUF2147 domain-containing protein [Rhodopila sp.]|uniref:DUF2147 domain-containing protein n=1 Tax=Rhodopila sp. TaxID=2480087 RepID=UPI003D10C644
MFAISAVMLMISAPAVIASPVDGNWALSDVVLRIFDCQTLVCGKVVWTKDPQTRGRDCGRTVVWGLSQTDPKTWSGGSIYDPNDGTTYGLSATLAPDGTLHARIYRGVSLFGKTKILRKVAPKSLDGWCA